MRYSYIIAQLPNLNRKLYQQVRKQLFLQAFLYIPLLCKHTIQCDHLFKVGKCRKILNTVFKQQAN